MSLSARWSALDIGLTLAGTATRLDAATVVLQISGSQDWDPIHFDADGARASGHPGVFLNSTWTAAMLVRPLTDWLGFDGRLRRVEFQMRGMITPGDVVQAGAKVTGKWVADDGDALVNLDVWLETDRLGVTTTGSALASFTEIGGSAK